MHTEFTMLVIWIYTNADSKTILYFDTQKKNFADKAEVLL